MKLRSVAEAFAEYRAKVIPGDAPTVQVTESRRAFYAGAYFLLMDGLVRIGAPDCPEDEAVAALETMQADIETFFRAELADTPPTDTPPADAPPAATAIEVASIFGARTKQGLVELTVAGRAMQLDLAKAREIVGMLQGAIEAAVSDQLLYTFLTTKLGAPETAAARALLDFRELRQGSRGTVYPS